MSNIILHRNSITVRTYHNGTIKNIILDKDTLKEINQNMQDLLDRLTETAWKSYCKSVGNKSVNGVDLPTWEELKADESKQHIVNGWRAAVSAVIEDYEKFVN